MKLPYFLALFQGENFYINVKVNKLSATPDMDFGYMEVVWIKCYDKEWLVDLERQTIEHTRNAANTFREVKYERSLEPQSFSNGRIDHNAYFIQTEFGELVTMSYKRGFRPFFNKKFIKKYKNYENCCGAIISKNHIKYLNHLKEIIV